MEIAHMITKTNISLFLAGVLISGSILIFAMDKKEAKATNTNVAEVKHDTAMLEYAVAQDAYDKKMREYQDTCVYSDRKNRDKKACKAFKKIVDRLDQEACNKYKRIMQSH
jgi:hypothetical protein